MNVKFDEIFTVDGRAVFVVIKFSGKKTYYYLASRSKKILKRIGPIPSRNCYEAARNVFLKNDYDFPTKESININKSSIAKANLKIGSNDARKKRIELLNHFGIQYLQHGFLLIINRYKSDKKYHYNRIKDLDAAIRRQKYILKKYNNKNSIIARRHDLLKNEHNWLNASLKTAAANMDALIHRKKTLIQNNRNDVLHRLIVIKKHLESLWPAPYYYRARESLIQLECAKKCFDTNDYQQMRLDLAEAHRWLLEY